MSIPTATDLNAMGYTLNGEPFIEVDGQFFLTSPGHMGVTLDGEPVTYVSITNAPPVEFRRLNFKLTYGPMGIKKPNLP